MNYELTVGLETHFELLTDSKIFCPCKVKFGSEPNTNCCPICIGLPGTLPTLNKKVVEYAVKAGLALNCEISNESSMSRKNYIYPDLPKAYQISQFKSPLCKNGYFELKSGKKIRINRVHIEEDAGKLIHCDDKILIDYNRAGIPLIEIVTEPDFSSAEEVCEYLEMLRLIMKYLGISDCKMQEGSMRCDVNISCRKSDENIFGTRTEIKNMNSLTFISNAIKYEFNRQKQILENGGKIIRQTMRYNESDSSVSPMRKKESTDDYRYFEEPDILPFSISCDYINAIKDSMPESLQCKINRFKKDYKIDDKDIMQIIKYPKIMDFFEKLIEATSEPKLCLNVILTVIFKHFKSDSEKDEFKLCFDSKEISDVILMCKNGKFSSGRLKSILNEMFEKEKTFNMLYKEDDFLGISDTELFDISKKVILSNEKAVSDYKSGKEKAIFSLVGAVMQIAKGKANAQKVKQTLEKIINTP